MAATTATVLGVTLNEQGRFLLCLCVNKIISRPVDQFAFAHSYEEVFALGITSRSVEVVLKQIRLSLALVPITRNQS